MTSQIGEALRLIRVFHDEAAKKTAAELKISSGHLSIIESGQKKPSPDLLGRYAMHFDIPLSGILLFAEELDEAANGGIKGRARGVMLKFLKIIEKYTAS